MNGVLLGVCMCPILYMCLLTDVFVYIYLGCAFMCASHLRL